MTRIIDAILAAILVAVLAGVLAGCGPDKPPCARERVCRDGVQCVDRGYDYCFRYERRTNCEDECKPTSAVLPLGSVEVGR